MKAIFLNCWYGEVKRPFFEFIKNESKNVDIFCFQEVNHELHTQISKVLSNYSGIESHKYVNSFEVFDISIFISKRHKIINPRINIIKNMKIGDCVTVQVNNFIIVGVHGMSRPGNKLDSPERIEQSKEILEATKTSKLPVIIGGDFNLMPNTKSIKVVEKSGYVNLIKEFNITETRNRLAWETFKNKPDFVQQHFADYCFVSNDIKIKSFEVPDIEISDHLPLILDFEV